jgi:hypothetical protein
VLSDPVAVALSVAEMLEACGLRYLVGGSLASSMSGEPRSTLDVDIVVATTESDIGTVTQALGAEFDVDEQAVARAVRERSSVNVFHRASAIKVDLFIMGGSPLDDEQMIRPARPCAADLARETEICRSAYYWFGRHGEEHGEARLPCRNRSKTFATQDARETLAATERSSR